MLKSSLIEVLKRLSEFKRNSGVDFVDTHIHPLDVMGVTHFSETNNFYCNSDYYKPGILELLDYNKIEKIGSRIYFKFFPKSVGKIIHNTYDNVNPERIISEMKNSLIDQSVLLSLDPWVPTDEVGALYKDRRPFLILGSLDINNIEVKNIKSKIINYINQYGIVGLKFHPNLQNFKPQPKDNKPEIAEKLSRIYEVTQENNLYILFHGGISNFTNNPNKKYHLTERSHCNAMLENFCDNNGKSEIFEKYNFPIVIAHLGHYGLAHVNYDLIKKISNKYPHVFFDTSGISPYVLRKTFDIISSKKVIFGSDALYNRIAYNMAFLYNAVIDTTSSEKKDDILRNVLSDNFLGSIMKKK